MLTKQNRFFLSLIYFCILATGVELTFRYFLRARDLSVGTDGERHLYAAYRSHSLNPDYRRPFDTGGKKIHSPDGFRSDHPISKIKVPGTYRILAMGASALYGVGVQRGPKEFLHPSLTNQQTISAQLENRLNEKLRENHIENSVEVINAGVSAYKVFVHPIYFAETLYQYHPDLIVFLDGHNDYYDTALNGPPLGNYRYGTQQMIDSFIKRMPLFTLYSLLRLPTNYSYFFKALELSVRDAWDKYEAPSPAEFIHIAPNARDFWQQLAEVSHRTWMPSYVQMKALAEYHHFRMHVFRQPELMLEDQNLLSVKDKEVRKWAEQVVAETPHQVWTRMREKYSATHFQNLFDRQQIPFSDLSEIASERTSVKNLYLDWCHLSPDGAEETGGRMAQVLYPKILDELSQNYDAQRHVNLN